VAPTLKLFSVIDDCWASGRDATGKLIPDPVAFPSGIAPLAAYVKSKGAKLGTRYIFREPHFPF
jgi:hypothetical protein